MRQTFVLVCVALFLSSGVNSRKGCEYFKTGVFKMDTDWGGKIHKYRIERDDSFQVEVNLKTDARTTFRVFWKTPCKYVLKYHSGPTEIKDPAMLAKLKVTTKMVKTGENYYVFSSTSNLFHNVITDTLWKVE